MGAHMKFSRRDIHSLVFSNPDSGAACGGNFCQMVLVFF